MSMSYRQVVQAGQHPGADVGVHNGCMCAVSRVKLLWASTRQRGSEMRQGLTSHLTANVVVALIHMLLRGAHSPIAVVSVTVSMMAIMFC
jgi:hypothetical protein